MTGSTRERASTQTHRTCASFSCSRCTCQVPNANVMMGRIHNACALLLPPPPLLLLPLLPACSCGGGRGDGGLFVVLVDSNLVLLKCRGTM
jgi:hypothetical protein